MPVNENETMMKRPWRFNWRTKLLCLFLLFSVTPLLAFSCWMFQDLGQRFGEATISSLQGLGQAKAQAIEQFITDRVRQVDRISTLVVPELVELRRSPPDLPEPQGTELPEPPEVRSADETTPGSASTPNAASSDVEGKSASPDAASSIGDTSPTVPSATEPQTDALSVDVSPRATEINAPPASLPGTPDEGALPKRPTAEKVTNPRRIAAAPPLKESTPPTRAALRKTLGLILWDQGEYEELLVMDPIGNVLVSTFTGHEGTSAANIDYFQKGLSATYVQQPFMSPLTKRLTMVIATPIKDETQQVIGVLAARLNLDTFFRLIGDRTGLGETGETVVGRLEGSEFVFTAPTRHDVDAALKRKVPLDSDNSHAFQEAAGGQTGSGRSIDYRGKNVFAAWQPIPSLGWGLVVKIEQSESRKAVFKIRLLILFVTLGIVVLAAVCSIAMSKALVSPLLELLSATERISRGDLDVRLSIRSNDEVGDLAESFERMVAAIKFFQEDKVPEEYQEPAQQNW